MCKNSNQNIDAYNSHLISQLKKKNQAMFSMQTSNAKQHKTFLLSSIFSVINHQLHITTNTKQS